MKPSGKEKQALLKKYREEGKSPDWLAKWERGWHQKDQQNTRRNRDD